MKKLYTLLFIALTAAASAQITSTLVTANYFGGNTRTLFTDLSSQNLYYYTLFQLELKKVESNNTETLLLSRNVTSNFAKAPRFNNNKGIFIVPTSTATTKVYLFNNTAVDSIVLNQNLTFAIINTKDYVIGSGNNPSYFWIQDKFYKTNLTGTGTTTISLASGNTSYSVTTAKEVNGKLLVGANASNGNKYIFYYDGTTASKIDSLPITVNASTRFEGYINPANADAFMFIAPGFVNDSSYSKLWKLTGTGAPTVITTSKKIKRAYTTLNNKLIARIYTTASNEFVTVDLSSGALTPITDNSGLNLSGTQTEYFQSNGNVAYFAGYNNNNVIAPLGNVPCFTNGLTMDTVTTKSVAQITSNMNGAFCGNEYWFKNLALKTEIINANKTFTIIPQNFTSTQTYAPLAAYSHIYYFKDNASANYDLYKSACSAQVGINELNLSTINFKIYPNPANEILNIELSADFDSAQSPLIITNILGQVVLTETLTISTSLNTSTKNSTLNIQNLNLGVYLLRVGNSKAIKFIKE